jgi:sulfopyruvate decarboxylase subunit beta
MNRVEAMSVFSAARAGAAVITTGPGQNSGLLYAQADEPATIYNMDLAYATPIALGMALARPKRRVLVVEGDGSFYAGSTSLSTMWRMRPANLTVVVLDNGVWGTGDGREPTATSCGVDLVKLALASGWDTENVHGVDDARELENLLSAASQKPGPHLIVAKTDATKDLPSSGVRLRPGRHILECALMMRADLTKDA